MTKGKKKQKDSIQVFRNIKDEWVLSPSELVEKIRPSLKNPNSIGTDGSYVYLYTYDQKIVAF